jgi:hypothetical protein
MAHLAEILKKRNGVHFESMPLTISQARRELLAITRENGVLARQNHLMKERVGDSADDD